METILEAFATAVRHHQEGRLKQAEQICRQILAVDANQAQAWGLLGAINAQSGNPQMAADYFGRAIGLAPNNADHHRSLGDVYQALGKPDDAVACYRRALELNPDFPEALNNLGAALQRQSKLEDAVACYRRVLELRPDHAKAHNNLGAALQQLWTRDEAAACFQRAIQLQPDYANAHYNLANVLRELGKRDEAIACYQRALSLRPHHAEAHYDLANALRDLGRSDEAVGHYRRALELDPNHRAALISLVHERQHLCQWEGLELLSRQVIDLVDQNDRPVHATAMSPFSFTTLPIATTPGQQLQCARRWVEQELGLALDIGRGLSFVRPPRDKPKITIGYLSADFRSHATASLIAELLERHDHDRFTIFGYSYGPDDGSPMRARLAGALDRLVDVRDLSFVDAAKRIAEDEVDILVDLKGYTAEARTQIVALRPAPIQVNYLGYPGTMGASFVDYILVDDFVVPEQQQPFFAEKLVHLPGCYQVNDSRRPIAEHTPSRGECGLPESGFVFCSFNNTYKITPAVFDVWMKLLAAIPGSVLWLFEANRFAAANLRSEAQARGIHPARLVFAPRVAPAEHLARHRLVDLFLDTFPVNAHTTASDALWAGCPLVTMAGETFVSRVAGSLLRALGLDELVASRLAEYQALALRLATNPGQLAELRARLAANRTTSDLFDAGRFARSLEQAYSRMWETYASGGPPCAFRVDAK